jgi:hypothetical protein
MFASGIWLSIASNYEYIAYIVAIWIFYKIWY